MATEGDPLLSKEEERDVRTYVARFRDPHVEQSFHETRLRQTAFRRCLFSVCLVPVTAFWALDAIVSQVGELFFLARAAATKQKRWLVNRAAPKTFVGFCSFSARRRGLGTATQPHRWFYSFFCCASTQVVSLHHASILRIRC